MNIDLEKYQFWKLTAGVICTIGLYSVLYRETKLYRFFEHVFLGLAAGWASVTLWVETLKPQWWDKMVGREEAGTLTNGYWAWSFLLPLGFMAYFVYSKKHNWISRVPIGVIIGLWSGQQVSIWWNRYGPQIYDTARPVLPTTSELFMPSMANLPPDQAAEVARTVYLSTAISNLVFIITALCVLSYFLFSIEFKNRFLKGMTMSGRWLLMVGFGAIFGSTVMMRFTLLIDRMYFVWIEWLEALTRTFSGG
ncbi:MAG: hypothetical protein M5U21_08175 [Fimbriimonadaceae bacterium]|nr:hypothetical protein [Fimbriimonadaceae bacterium]RIK01267.1 MAG: hypothetical protein DCC46_01565 [Armatimonadota bacterium]